MKHAVNPPGLASIDAITAALAEVQLTSSFKGDGIAALRTHLATLAQ